MVGYVGNISFSPVTSWEMENWRASLKTVSALQAFGSYQDGFKSIDLTFINTSSQVKVWLWISIGSVRVEVSGFNPNLLIQQSTLRNINITFWTPLYQHNAVWLLTIFFLLPIRCRHGSAIEAKLPTKPLYELTPLQHNWLIFKNPD